MTWHIRKLGYSSNPWRIVTDTGLEVTLEHQTINLWDNTTRQQVPHTLPVYGYPTRTAATNAVLAAAERFHNQLTNKN